MPPRLCRCLLLIPFVVFPQNRPLGDAVPRNALNRFDTSLKKVFSDRLDALTDEQIEASQDITAVKAFVDRCEQDGDGSTEDEADDDDEDEDDEEEEEEGEEGEE